MKATHVTESYRRTNRPAADQGAIWDDIALKSQRLGAHSPTSAMDAMYERTAGDLDQLEVRLAPQPQQAGAIFAVNGAPAGVEVFDCPATCRRLLPKLLASYGLDAIDRAHGLGVQPQVRGLGFDAKMLLCRVKALQQEHYPAVGLGEDVRLSSADMHGAALVVGDRLLHLAVFPHQGPA